MSKIIFKKSFISIVFAISFASATQVNAATYLYEIDNPSGINIPSNSNGAGNITFFFTTYDDDIEKLSFKSTIQKANGNLANGFWLVLSDGPFPQMHKDEYAIFYGDGLTGNPDNLTASVYDGPSSWDTPGVLIESFAGGLGVDSTINDEVTFHFSIDVSAINNYLNTNDWNGASFAENIGVWYQPVVISGDPVYVGLQPSFPFEISSWYDANGLPTKPILPDVDTVPAPATAWLVFVGLMGFAGAKRRRI